MGLGKSVLEALPLRSLYQKKFELFQFFSCVVDCDPLSSNLMRATSPRNVNRFVQSYGTRTLK